MAERPLAGWRLLTPPGDPAALYAGDLLRALGADEAGRGPELVIPPAPGSGAADWAASGAMALTGFSDGPPLAAPGRPATAARAALLALEALGGPGDVAGHQLLGERASLLGYHRNAPWSTGGGCRAVRAQDGWVAVSLARPSDLDAVPALVCAGGTDDPWEQLESWASTVTAAEVADRAQLLGIPAAPVAVSPAPVWPPWQITCLPGDPSHERPRVVDLSSLWAGPLCASLLGLAGAEVVRVESTRRPDGGRHHPAFDDLLHARQPSVALAFDEPSGRRSLQQLVCAADVVITSARTRALRALGLQPQDHAGVWVSITAHPVRADGTEWVGFGDDAAMAAGLVQWDDRGRPLPCGDAIADPLTGVHAALAAYACVRAGGRHHVRLNLHDVASSTLTGSQESPTSELVTPPRARSAIGTARPLGIDTEWLLAAR